MIDVGATLPYMLSQRRISLVAATAVFAVGLALAAPAPAEEDAGGSAVDRLFERLQEPDQAGWKQIEQAIAREWSKSGSPAMDLLLQRGREAIQEGDLGIALEHLTALTDHAPDFAEGWNSRATAHFQAENYGRAMHDLSRALALEPRHFGAMIGLATILREVGERERALKVLRDVHEIHPHRPNVIEGIERLSGALEGETL